LHSPRFLASEGGLARVGWMNSELKARLDVHAEHIATEKDCINLAGLKEHLAARRH
jgi:CO dehydrogenase/acetyl-CoA synthase beta subunit